MTAKETTHKHRILMVDDDDSVREVFSLMLREKGYEVATAENGFDALLKLKDVIIPDVIISDLNMRKMSGFEFLSVVRRRFPKISVIASSGAYGSRAVPTGVLADAFYAKGEDHPDTLLNSVASFDRDFFRACNCPSERLSFGLDSAERKRLE